MAVAYVYNDIMPAGRHGPKTCACCSRTIVLPLLRCCRRCLARSFSHTPKAKSMMREKKIAPPARFCLSLLYKPQKKENAPHPFNLLFTPRRRHPSPSLPPKVPK